MSDIVNHPSHYADGWSNGAEVIDITENLNFNRGNAVKYIARAGRKNPDAELEDLRKAEWYIQREIERLRGDQHAKLLAKHSGYTEIAGVTQYGCVCGEQTKTRDEWYQHRREVGIGSHHVPSAARTREGVDHE